MRIFFGNIFTWVKTHKIICLLLAIIGYFLFHQNSVVPLIGSRSAVYDTASFSLGAPAAGGSMEIAPMMKSSDVYYRQQAAPNLTVTDRKVITNNTMSLKVKSVKDTIAAVKNKVNELKGYVVTTNLSTPEFGESGYITLRVPTLAMDTALQYFRSLAIKVVSEDTSGNDITDQYIDYQAKLERLNATKKIFEDMLSKATTIDDILRVQNEIFNQQAQIDSIIGQMKYMDGASSSTLISLNLSTDELGLPITPVKSWRPEIVFKQAYRSMLATLYDVGEAAIWLAVYLPLILGVFAVFMVIKRLFTKK